jgi:hypothetical protein
MLRILQIERKEGQGGVDEEAEVQCEIINIFSFFFFLVSWGRVRLSPQGTSATVWPIVSATDDR